jgi:phosphoserine phosphatase RsbU/P
LQSATDGLPITPPIGANIVARPTTQQKQRHLKLYTEQPPKPVRPAIEAVGCLPELLRAFQAATGWSLRYDPSAKPKGLKKSAKTIPLGGTANEAGVMVLEPAKKQPAADSSPGPTPLVRGPSPAQTLAGSLGHLLGELFEARQALRQREAELAAGVPVVPHREEEKHLAARLEAVLRAGAEAVGCDAAALYLIDEATTKLKLRCSWGLPFDRLTAPARPLQGALADLDALLGHAIVLDDHDTMQMWNMPEDFASAVCVPVSTPTTLLGTLWVFCQQRRDFNSRETNLLEVVAGRLAAELEREMLLRTAVDASGHQRQLAAAERLQRNESPTIAPMLDGWDVAGWNWQAEGVGGAFYDWFCLPDGLLAATAGCTDASGVAGAMTAGAVKAALRSHACYHRQVECIVQQANVTLWTGSAGDRRVTLFHGLVDTAAGRVRWASAGEPTILRSCDGGWQSLGQRSTRLGKGPQTNFEPFDCELAPGESLLVLVGGSPADGALLAEVLKGKQDLSAEELAAAARSALDACRPGRTCGDRSLVVIRRTL